MGGWGMTGRNQQLCWLGCFGAVVGVLLAARAVPGPPPASGADESPVGDVADCACGNEPPDLSTEDPGRPGWATAGLTGNVSECCCTYLTSAPQCKVLNGLIITPLRCALSSPILRNSGSFNDLERTNAELVLPLLARVVATDFFAHFRVDLCTDCRLWHDAPLCVRQLQLLRH